MTAVREGFSEAVMSKLTQGWGHWAGVGEGTVDGEFQAGGKSGAKVLPGAEWTRRRMAQPHWTRGREGAEMVAEGNGESLEDLKLGEGHPAAGQPAGSLGSLCREVRLRLPGAWFLIPHLCNQLLANGRAAQHLPV